jgi:hypothetical protein
MKHQPNVQQSGAIAVLAALLLPFLMSVMALAIDVAYLLLSKNRLQVAADAAALVAADARLHNQDSNSALTVALNASQANGFLNGVDATRVTVLIPPGGNQAFALDTRYVRVTISQPVTVFLAWIFGGDVTTVSAMAVAGPAGNSPSCLMSLASAEPGALSISGNGILAANGCGIYVNSSSSIALQATGNSTISAAPINVVGGYIQGQNVTMSPVTIGTDVTADPYSSLNLPEFGRCNFVNFLRSGNDDVVLVPGTYCGGINIAGNHSVVFNPGLYVLYGGGINFSGNISPVSGHDLTIYNSGNSTTYLFGALDFSGNARLNLSAPTTGLYAGMLLMQDPLNKYPASISGNAGATLGGNMYFPQAVVTIGGNSALDISTGSIVALKVSVTGNTHLSMTSNYGSGGSYSLRAGLYE